MKNTQIEKVCPKCQKIFKVKKSHAEIRRFCSKLCMALGYRTRKEKEVTCRNCGVVFKTLFRSKRWGFKKFCTKICYLSKFSGEMSPAWKGGKWASGAGYIRTKNSYEHREIMEEYTGRKLLKREKVHHWDADRGNNKLENLCILRHDAAHSRLHAFARRHKKHIKEFFFDQPWLAPMVVDKLAKLPKLG